jgi:outer membrane lipoprotein-sorting protein
MRDMRVITIVPFLLNAVLAGTAGAKPDPEAIVRRSLSRMVFRSQGAEMTMTMTLRNKRGETRTRKLFARTRKADGLTRTLVRFVAPSDVAGTAFLFVQHKDRDDDQHMFLPALKVVKRIVGKQKQGKFMGSDFSYADLEWEDLEKARYEMKPEQKVGRAACHVIDSTPKRKEAYDYTRSWIRKKDDVPLRIQYFDRRKQLLKVLYVKKVKKVGKGLMVTQLKMSNKQTGHSTFIVIDKIKLRDDLPADAFTVRALKQR